MILYFDNTVEEGLGKNELQRLIQIATRFGATITKDVNEVGNGRVTHIVAYDPEEHDTKEVIDEEERREKNNEEMDKSFLKTLAVLEVPVDVVGEEEDDTSYAANAASPDSKKNGEGQQHQPTSITKPSPNHPPSSGTKQKGRPCGQCEACSREDCGECKQCKDKKKFGGPNKMRQRCCLKVCQNRIMNDGGGGGESTSRNATAATSRPQPPKKIVKPTPTTPAAAAAEPATVEKAVDKTSKAYLTSLLTKSKSSSKHSTTTPSKVTKAKATTPKSAAATTHTEISLPPIFSPEPKCLC